MIKPQLKKYKFVFDLLQTRSIYPFYEKVLNTTNDRYSNNKKDPISGVFTDAIHVVNWIPPFLKPHINTIDSGLQAITLKEYQGFMADLSNYGNVNDYLKDTMGAKSRTKIRGYVRKLETCFNITYKLYFGAITRSEYDMLFSKFHSFIIERFFQRGDTHEAISSWEFIERSSYDMILNKTASLFVIYNDQEPIDICLNYHYENIFHNGIRSYNIDYSKFRLGYIDILKQLEWCLANRIQIFDLSSGDMQYKRMLCNVVYNFEHQILYDKKSISKKTLAHSLAKFYSTKEYLKKKKIHLLYHKIKKLAGKESKQENYPSEPQIEQVVLDKAPDIRNSTLVDLRNDTYAFLRIFVYNFQYQFAEHSQNIKVYEANDQVKQFYILGERNMQQLKKL